MRVFIVKFLYFLLDGFFQIFLKVNNFLLVILFLLSKLVSEKQIDVVLLVIFVDFLNSNLDHDFELFYEFLD